MTNKFKCSKQFKKMALSSSIKNIYIYWLNKEIFDKPYMFQQNMLFADLIYDSENTTQLPTERTINLASQ